MFQPYYNISGKP